MLTATAAKIYHNSGHSSFNNVFQQNVSAAFSITGFFIVSERLSCSHLAVGKQ